MNTVGTSFSTQRQPSDRPCLEAPDSAYGQEPYLVLHSILAWNLHRLLSWYKKSLPSIPCEWTLTVFGPRRASSTFLSIG